MCFSLYIDFVSLYLFVITFLKVYDNEDEDKQCKKQCNSNENYTSVYQMSPAIERLLTYLLRIPGSLLTH